jgi:hypothetical protein
LDFASRSEDALYFLSVIWQACPRKHVAYGIQDVGIFGAKCLKFQGPPVCRNKICARQIVLRKEGF